MQFEEKFSARGMAEDLTPSEEHMKAMWAGQSNVLVAVRARPLMKHDVIKKGCVRVLDNKVVVILDPALGDKADILRVNRNRERQYAFDYVFEQGSSQEQCYVHTTKFLIHGVLDGFNATVFAYGQTGSGKTHTMIGTPSDPGIMVRVMDDLYIHSVNQGKQLGHDFKVLVSFLEVYNENIRDLLSDVEEYLDLREDPIKGPVVAGITEVEAKTSQEVMQLLHQGNAKRFQAATAANEVSSRSHAVLQVIVESKDRAPGVVANIKVGKLSLVDLAGSERAANTKNTGVRLVEGANINRSLLALGNCINALGEKGNKGNFVPYRDSKLTRLLKDSLGGNCRTVMIANISSSESAFEETLNTLKYANRAKNIKTNIQRNVLNVNYHISEYVQLINNLRGEIKLLKDQMSSDGSQNILQGHAMGVLGNPQSLASFANSPTAAGLRHPTTPLHVLRESMKSAASITQGGGDREVVNNMRQRIVENFQERMQLRRSLIELEDQNVNNSIEVSKRQLIVVQWSETNNSRVGTPGKSKSARLADFSTNIIANGTGEIKEAWQECEQLRKAIMKNNGMKKSIAKRLRLNEREAEKFREELSTKITGEDRRELMELQYQVGRLELENMELEQHRIVHESILKGKDLVIQKLRLQLAVRDKLIQRQQSILKDNSLDDKVGYTQLALMEQTLMGDTDTSVAPPSPPRNMADMRQPRQGLLIPTLNIPTSSSYFDAASIDKDSFIGGDNGIATGRESIEGDWSEIQSELSDNSFGSPPDRRMKYAVASNKQNNGYHGSNSNNNNSGNSSNAYSCNDHPKMEVGGKGFRVNRGGRVIRSSNPNNNPSIAAGIADEYIDRSNDGKQQPLRPANARKNQSYPDFNSFNNNHVISSVGVNEGNRYQSDSLDDVVNNRNAMQRQLQGVSVDRLDKYSNYYEEKERDSRSVHIVGDVLSNGYYDKQGSGSKNALLSPGRGGAMNTDESDKYDRSFARDKHAMQLNIRGNNVVIAGGRSSYANSSDNWASEKPVKQQQYAGFHKNARVQKYGNVNDDFGEESIDTIGSDNSEYSEGGKGKWNNSGNSKMKIQGMQGNMDKQYISGSNVYMQNYTNSNNGSALNDEVKFKLGKNVVLSKLKHRIVGSNNAPTSYNNGNVQQSHYPIATDGLLRPVYQPHGAEHGFDRILNTFATPGIGGVSRPVNKSKSKKATKKDNMSEGDGNPSVQQTGGGSVIGGRNKSLPNLPKQQNGPLSARSNYNTGSNNSIQAK